jgi:hypothetical protein
VTANNLLEMAANKDKAGNVRAKRQAGGAVKPAEIVNYPGKRNVVNVKL